MRKYIFKAFFSFFKTVTYTVWLVTGPKNFQKMEIVISRKKLKISADVAADVTMENQF